MKKCVVNFACRGREAYLKGQERLRKSLRETCFDEVVLTYANAYPPECPTHQEVPYAFKWYMMSEALDDKGGELVLWLDASVVVRKSLDPIWKIVEERGVLVFDNPGIVEAAFTSKDCLDKLGCSLEEAQTFGQCCGGVVGLKKGNERAERILTEMLNLSKDGVSFQGGSNTSPYPKYQSHRHDQSCLSYLLHKYQIEKQPFDWLRYSCDDRGLNGAILELRGM